MTNTVNGQSNLLLNGRIIGDGNPVYLIAEAGATHWGIESAKKLVDVAIDAGFDAVKFQKVDAEAIDDKSEMFGDYTRYEILKQRMLTDAEWEELESYCKDKIFFFYTVSEEPKKFMKTYKIASRWLKDHDLIRKVSKQCNVIQLDTSNASLYEVTLATRAVDDNCGMIIHHCPSGYPSIPEKEKIRHIAILKELFKCPIAYSSHSNNLGLTIMAITAGANAIELPIRLNNSESISPENEYALSETTVKNYIEYIKEYEKAL